MKKNTLFVISLLVTLQCILAAFVYKTSAGHPSSTGSAGEQTCARSTCHDDASVQTGTGVNSISLSGSATTYVPGTTYTVTLTIQKPSISKFGFELNALKDSDNSNGGTLAVINANTQIINGESPFTARKYVTHTTAGTTGTTGSKSWTFRWTAPSTDVGPVTMYYATNCTNQSGTRFGDQIFLSSFKINPNTTSVNYTSTTESDLSGYYTQGRLYVTYSMEMYADVSVILYNLGGQSVLYKQLGGKASGLNRETIASETNLPAGIYILSVLAGEKVMNKKISIN